MVALSLTVIVSASSVRLPPSKLTVPLTMILSPSPSPPFTVSSSRRSATLVKLSVRVSSPVLPVIITFFLLAKKMFSKDSLCISKVWQPEAQLLLSFLIPPSAIVMVSSLLVPEGLYVSAEVNSYLGSILVYSTFAPS